jgi:mannose-6-phosphate isomerase-like protein (cupin superfamily)
MKLIKKSRGEVYEAKGHFNNWSVHKLTPGIESKKLNICLSHFLPNGGGVMSASAMERAYFVLNGFLMIKGKTEEYTLEPGDIIYIGAGEEREIKVVGNDPATILVIIANVE